MDQRTHASHPTATVVLNIPDSTKTPLSDIKPLLLSAFSRLLATSEDEILSGSSSVELLKSVNEIDDFSLYRESGSGKWISLEEDKAVSKVGLTSGDVVGVGFRVDGPFSLSSGSYGSDCSVRRDRQRSETANRRTVIQDGR